MVWGLAAAIAAGAANRFVFLWVSLPLFCISLILKRSIRAPAITIAALGLALFFYGHYTTQSLKEKQRFAERYFLVETRKIHQPLYGWVCGFPQVIRGGTQFRFRTRIEKRSLDLLVYAKTPGIDFGDSLRIEAKFVKKRSYDKKTSGDPFLLARGIAARVSVKQRGLSELDGSNGSWIKRRVFWPLHDQLRQVISRNLGSKSGIPLALLLGEKGDLDKRIKRTFIDLGISHLLALSGMHLGLIAGAVLCVFRCFRFKSRLALWLVLCLYVCTVGEIVSLFRAFTMASMLIAAGIAHRPMQPISALGNAGFLILLWSPQTIFSTGFQLSFLATFGVLLCIRNFSLPRGGHLFLRLRNYAISTIVVSVYVQVFITPLLIHHFGRLSTVSPIATLVFFPFVFVVLFLSLLCALSGLLSGIAASLLAPLLELTSGAFRWLLLFSGDISPPLIHVPSADVILYCTGVMLIWCSRKNPLKVLAGFALLLAAFLKPLFNS